MLCDWDLVGGETENLYAKTFEVLRDNAWNVKSFWVLRNKINDKRN